jgi:hypothetical protein
MKRKTIGYVVLTSDRSRPAMMPLKYYSVLPLRGGAPVVKLTRQYAGFRITTLAPVLDGGGPARTHDLVRWLTHRAEREFQASNGERVASW